MKAKPRAAPMSEMLTSLLNEAALQELAGARAFERGTDYYADGQVVGLKEENGKIVARVRGTYYYRVNLWAEDEKIGFECNCPVGHDGGFCKHCVAVGLAWLDRRKSTGGERRRTKREVTDDEIRAHLMAQDKGELVKLLLHHAEWDSDFRDRLVLMTAQKGGKAPDLPAFRAAVDKAIRRRSFVHYSNMGEYTRGIEAVVDSLANLLEQGHAAEVRELTERALRQMESALNHVDDSAGFMGGILDRLQDLHHRACVAARPEPVALAKFLLDWEIRSDWEIFSGAVGRYKELLGEKGLSAYRKLAEVEWAKVPPLAPGEKYPERYGARSRIANIMETLAKQAGDLEALVSVKTRDLSDAFSFLKIAEVYKEGGNNEAALEWAERGVRAFPVNTDNRLRHFLIEEYHSRGRHDEAIAVAWTGFCERPGLSAYQVLHNSVHRAKEWPPWREKALALLREDIAAKRKRPSTDRWDPVGWRDHSDLVEIHLWEGEVDAAWREAKAGGCHNGLWFRLAEAREKEHPEDAIAVYTAQLKPTLALAEQQAYEEGVELLRKIRTLLVRAGKEAEFESIVQSVRAQYKPRRNLMKLLDAEGW